MMHKLMDLKERLCRELEEYADKDGLDVGGLEVVDKLAHAVKNIGKIIEMMDEEEEYSMAGGRSYRGSYEGGGSYRGGSYEGGSYGGGSYERGGYSSRGRRNAKRDSMGRYSRRRSMAGEDIASQLEELMQQAPDEQTRMELQRMIQRFE